MALPKENLRHKKLAVLQKFAESRGFTEEYQQELINKEIFNLLQLAELSLSARIRSIRIQYHIWHLLR